MFSLIDFSADYSGCRRFSNHSRALSTISGVSHSGQSGTLGASGLRSGKRIRPRSWSKSAMITLMMFCSTLLLTSRLALMPTVMMSPTLLSDTLIGPAVATATNAKSVIATNFIFPIDFKPEYFKRIWWLLSLPTDSYTIWFLSAAAPASIKPDKDLSQW